MKRYVPLVLVALLMLVAGQVSATNLLVNGSFQSGDFTGWTLGTTPNGTAGDGFPIVTGWPLGGMNAAKYEVGEVNFTNLYEGATLSQVFTSAGGSTTLSVLWAAQGDGIHNNAEGGLFELILDGTMVDSHDVGQIGANDLVNGALSATLNLSAGQHTFEVDILRNFLALPGNTPYQYVTGADAEGAGGVPEPGTLVLLGSGIVGVAGMVRRKLNF
jgi:hypothetical protein